MSNSCFSFVPFGRAGLCAALLALVVVPCAQATSVHTAWPGSVAVLDGNRGGELVPRQVDAEAQLRYASGLKLALRKSSDEDRGPARVRTVAAYRAVREYFPQETWAAAEASFRAAELLRAANEPEAALAEFGVVREKGGDSPFRVRAVLEIGHLERRQRALTKALAAYEGVLADPASNQRQRDDAALWAGTVYRDLERLDDARRAWQRVADGAEDPLDRVRAWDLLAQELVAAGDLEGAASTLERCKEALAEPAAEETHLGDRVRSALTRMRAVDELQRAIDKKNNAKGDKPERKPRTKGDKGTKGDSGDRSDRADKPDESKSGRGAGDGRRNGDQLAHA